MKWNNCARTSMAFLSPRPTESFISSSGTRKRDGEAGGTTAVSPQQDWDATERVPPIRYGVRRSLGLCALTESAQSARDGLMAVIHQRFGKRKPLVIKCRITHSMARADL